MMFTANGSHYYVLTEKQSVNEPDNEPDSEPDNNNIENKEPNTPSEDVTSPTTGDTTQVWIWIVLILVGSVCFGLADVRKNNQQNNEK